jgi:uncharacterized protein (TIGR02300 family)
MATKQDRGTKRTCQNSECGARFYDLNRSPISCPICGSAYKIASSPAALAAVQAEDKTPRKVKKEEGAEVVVAEADTEEALAEVEADEAVAEDEDETFLEEEEEEGGDVSNIIGGPVAEGEEP